MRLTTILAKRTISTNGGLGLGCYSSVTVHQLTFFWKFFPCPSLIIFNVFTGKGKGVLYEDDGDGYGFTLGAYLLTHYVAELESSVVTVQVSRTEGSWTRPKRRLHVQILLGGGAKVHFLLFPKSLWELSTVFIL